MRINALKELHESGLKTYIFVSPIIPEITDVSFIVEETRGFANRYFFEVLNLRASGREFQELLRGEYPESYKVLTGDDAFEEFLWGLKREIRALGVKAEGIETHRKGWEFFSL